MRTVRNSGSSGFRSPSRQVLWIRISGYDCRPRINEKYKLNRGDPGCLRLKGPARPLILVGNKLHLYCGMGYPASVSSDCGSYYHTSKSLNVYYTFDDDTS